MTLTVGTGPFARRAPGVFNFDAKALPGHVLFLEDCAWRMRVVHGGRTVADSRRVRRLHETGYAPVLYFPFEDLDGELLRATDHTTHCPFKGQAHYWNVEVGGVVAANAVWGYPQPLESSPLPADLVAFDYAAMDAWYEEDELVFAHPRDPYHRVDVRQASQHVRVFVHGELMADTQRPLRLAETGLATRFYLPPEDVRTDLLSESATRTQCPYKGEAAYRSARVGERVAEDIAWTYPAPLAEAEKVAGWLCFQGEAVEIQVE